MGTQFTRAGFKILKQALRLPRKVGSFGQNLVLTEVKVQKSIRSRFLKQLVVLWQCQIVGFSAFCRALGCWFALATLLARLVLRQS